MPLVNGGIEDASDSCVLAACLLWRHRKWDELWKVGSPGTPRQSSFHIHNTTSKL
jgi:hypothetical protein